MKNYFQITTTFEMLFTWLRSECLISFVWIPLIFPEIHVINSWEKYFAGYQLNLEYCRIFVCQVTVLNQE